MVHFLEEGGRVVFDDVRFVEVADEPKRRLFGLLLDHQSLVQVDFESLVKEYSGFPVQQILIDECNSAVFQKLLAQLNKVNVLLHKVIEVLRAVRSHVQILVKLEESLVVEAEGIAELE